MVYRLKDDNDKGLVKALLDGQFKGTQGYAANGRAVAIINREGSRSIYGTEEDGTAARNWQNLGYAKYVTNYEERADEVEQVLPGNLKAFGILPTALRLNELALMGLEAGPDFPTKGWRAPVVGQISLGPSQVVIRPVEVAFIPGRSDQAGTLEFVERGATAPRDPRSKLTLSEEQDRETSLDDFRMSALSCKGALLFDRVADGGWERQSPTWLATTRGFLSLKEGPTATFLYDSRPETRACEVTSWFEHRLPATARAILMLDRCGQKKLTVSWNASGVILALEVLDPALDFILASSSCDSSRLWNSDEPPGQSQVREGPALHVVCGTLAPEAALRDWGVEAGMDGTSLVLTREMKAGAAAYEAKHFVPIDNWVRPAEAAANDPSGYLSPLRALLPADRDESQPLKLTLTHNGVTVGDRCFRDREAPTSTGALQHDRLQISS